MNSRSSRTGDDLFGGGATEGKKNFFDFEDDDDVSSNEFNTFTDSTDFSKTTSTLQLSPKTPSPKDETASRSLSASHLGVKLKIDNVERKAEEFMNSFTNLSISNTATFSTSVSSPRGAIDRIVAGDFCVNLSAFRGKEEKLELLDYALWTGNVNVITRIILFLRQTMKSSIFNSELLRRPIATDHYLVFLRETEQTEQLLDALSIFGRFEDHGFAMYSRALATKSSPDSQVRLLGRTYQAFSTSGAQELQQWQGYINEQVSLLEQQLPIEADDTRREHEEKEKNSGLFVLFPRPRLVGMSVIDTLHYSILYHFLLQDNHFASPVFVKNKFLLNEKQYLWTALQALSKASMWPEIDNLFEYKSWLGSRKIKNTIPTEDIVRILHRFSAPPEMIEKYLEILDDAEKRYQLSRELLMNKFAADVLIKLKDRKRLAELQASIATAHEVDYVQRYIENALKTSTIKWKN